MAETCAQLASDITALHAKLATINPNKQGLIDEILNEISEKQSQQQKQGCLNTPQFSGNTFVGAAAASSGNVFVVVVVDTDGRVYYSWSVLSGAPSLWNEIPNAPKTDAAPAVALVGDQHNYLLVWLKSASTNEAPGQLHLAQGTLGQGFVPWT